MAWGESVWGGAAWGASEAASTRIINQFNIAASINAIERFDITASIATINQFNIAASIAAIEQIDFVVVIISNIQAIAINGQIGVIQTTQITLSAIIPMTDSMQFNLISLIRLTQQNSQTIQINAVIRLLDDIDSVVIDVQKPELPSYGSYQCIS